MPSLNSITEPDDVSSDAFSYDADGNTGCLLIHGFTGTPWVLRELGKKLAEQGVAVEAPLLAGHGGEKQDLNRVKWQEWYKQCLEAYQRLCNQKKYVSCIGFSMGGSLALMLAAEKPCQKLVTISAPIRIDNKWLHFLPFFQLFIKYIKKSWLGVHRSIESYIGYDCYPTRALAEYCQVIEHAKTKVRHIQCPTLILHGKNDHTVPVTNAEEIYRKIGSDQKYLKLLDAGSHNLLLRASKTAVIDEILSFIIDRV